MSCTLVSSSSGPVVVKDGLKSLCSNMGITDMCLVLMVYNIVTARFLYVHFNGNKLTFKKIILLK